MAQENVWDREYKNSKLLTKENKPQRDVVRFVKFLRENGVNLENSHILDLGSGTGRNSYYFAEMGNDVIGLEISKTAIDIAKDYMSKRLFNIKYVKHSIGERFPIDDNSIEIVLDVTSSNSLSESEREMYLAETHRVLKRGGYFFVKALCKDGDANAKHLLKEFPGKPARPEGPRQNDRVGLGLGGEKDTYIMPELGVTERVWTKEDFVSTYQKYFTISYLEKKTSYSRMNNRSYKRNFWICYMKKT